MTVIIGRLWRGETEYKQRDTREERRPRRCSPDPSPIAPRPQSRPHTSPAVLLGPTCLLRPCPDPRRSSLPPPARPVLQRRRRTPAVAQREGGVPDREREHQHWEARPGETRVGLSPRASVISLTAASASELFSRTDHPAVQPLHVNQGLAPLASLILTLCPPSTWAN
ncbi:uncharacterized protein LAESUDRAFT_755204 [Laetiporus sulphureus 93-53]|uniref:Uncharacterized protein n=1 Tax=Laetiporus sulphureus 93-53 TaxID=1314785 RepID=A0A165HCZ2_9APHY|nr:uncharacterized protein LAESUDRAFT_755204 [Laetiporus sulphureus 93-53]KZT11567.1 hypothetical protein LAESUDRAFT_755204 [Laetiporus sulphureus 93-53]